MDYIKQAQQDLNIDFINSKIDSDRFPSKNAQTVEILKFERPMDVDEILSDLKARGYEAATLPDLLAWAKTAWNGKDTIVALGSSFENENGEKRIPYLTGIFDDRYLSLGWNGIYGIEHGFAAVKIENL